MKLWIVLVLNLLLAFTQVTLGVNPEFCTELLTGSSRVSERVVGLYESIPTRDILRVSRLEFRTVLSEPEFGNLGMSTDVTTTRGENVGRAVTNFDSRDGTLYLVSIELVGRGSSDVPRMIKPTGVVPLIAGRGTPPGLFMRLLHLKRLLGISAANGGRALQRVTAQSISSDQTAIEFTEIPEVREFLQKIPPPIPDRHTSATVDTEALNQLLSRHIGETQTGRYMRDIIIQSGSCLGPAGFVVTEALLSSVLNRLIDRSRSPRELALRSEAMRTAGVNWIPRGFNVSVDVVPCR